MRNIEKWRSRLVVDLGRSKSDDDFMATCPCHLDSRSSLHVYVGKKSGEVLMKCFVCGATGSDVCKDLGVPINWLEADAENADQGLLGKDEPDSVARRIVEHMCRTNGKTYGYEDLRCAVVWLESFEVAANAVCCMAEHIAGRRDTVRDELVRTLVNAFADRLGSKVMQMLNDEVEASTPEVPE